MIIAIDGTAASGKGTLARLVAHHYGLKHLDTGKIYRALGLKADKLGIGPNDATKLGDLAKNFDSSELSNPALNSGIAGVLAARYSPVPELREAILDFQRQFAAQEPGAVLDGRDIGTVVLPHADCKIFVDAELGVRAKRRLAEVRAHGADSNEEEIKRELADRDEKDKTRAVAPLQRAMDAVLLDTTALNIETAFRAAIAIVEDACRLRRKAT